MTRQNVGQHSGTHTHTHTPVPSMLARTFKCPLHWLLVFQVGSCQGNEKQAAKEYFKRKKRKPEYFHRVLMTTTATGIAPTAPTNVPSCHPTVISYQLVIISPHLLMPAATQIWRETLAGVGSSLQSGNDPRKPIVS